MKILLCTVPNGSLEGTIEPLLNPKGQNNAKHLIEPLGVLRIQSWIEKYGFNADIYDINNIRGTDDELIKNFKAYKPTVVGLGAGLTHCWPNVKRISKILRELFPDIWIVVGGAITGSANVILAKTDIDICVVGDGEVPFLKLLDYFKLNPVRKKSDFSKLSQIQGIAFMDEDNKLKVTGNGERLPASKVTSIHQPNYDKAAEGLQKFAGNAELMHEFFEPLDNLPTFVNGFLEQQLYPNALEFFEKNKNKKLGMIMTATGCVARCTFCQRYIKGYRVYEPSDFERHLIELKEKWNVRGVMINDENSLSNRKVSMEMAKIMKKHDIYWTAGGVRVTTCTYEDLKFYKEHNLLAVRFGIESGSQKILDIMEKKISKEDAYKALGNCRKLGIGVATDMFMLGMPGETRDTVLETAEMSGNLRHLVGKDCNINNTALAMAIPGTPLYEYCQQIGIIGKTIDEESDYLDRTSLTPNKDILAYLNKTDFSIKEVHYWTYLYRYAGRRAFADRIFKSDKSIKNKLLEFYEKCIKATIDRLNRSPSARNNSKIKYFVLLMSHTLLSISILILPKKLLYYIIKLYADLMFYDLKKKHKSLNGKETHNLFVKIEQEQEQEDYKLDEKKIRKFGRKIDLSLRKVVMNNRQKMNPPTTEEEKGLQLLAEGQ